MSKEEQETQEPPREGNELSRDDKLGMAKNSSTTETNRGRKGREWSSEAKPRAGKKKKRNTKEVGKAMVKRGEEAEDGSKIRGRRV